MWNLNPGPPLTAGPGATPPLRGEEAIHGGCALPGLVQRALDGEIDVAAFVSHRMRLDDVNHAFELMEQQDGIRTVSDFD